MANVWAHSQNGGGHLIVLLAIADFADDDGYAYPSMGTLARKARMTERNAQYVVKKLVADGELEVERGAGPKGCNLFRVVKLSVEGGETQRQTGVKPAAPDPSSGSIKKPSRARKRAGDEYGKAAREAALFLHSEYERIYASEEHPLMEGVPAGIGHFKRLLRKLSPDSPPKNVEKVKSLITWWMERWNDQMSPEYQRHDFSCMAFVQGFTSIRAKWEETHAPSAQRR
jgi:hypothetical protein